MTPAPGVPSTSESSSINHEPSPSKKIKTEIIVGSGQDAPIPNTKELKEEAGEVDDGFRTRKRVSAILRLGDIITPALNDHVQQSCGTKSPSSSAVSDDVLRKSIQKYDLETDASVLERRRKQIEYGKFTQDYIAYSKAIPRLERLPDHPKTPNQKRKYSRRAWDGLVKQWRVGLHLWNNLEELRLEKQRRKELNESFSSETTSNSESGINARIKQEDNSWFEECEDFYEGDDNEDDDEDDYEFDNIEVTVKCENSKKQ